MTIQLDTQARVTVDNSGAIGPLKSTQAATREVAQEMQQAGTSATTSGKQIAAAAREAERAQVAAARAVDAARRQEERATQSAIKAIQAYGAEARVANQAAVTAARQSRTAYQQLGFQISDVAAQAAVGTNPMIIFAQQGGQIAQAVSGFGGVLGVVGRFLAGPWGAAVLGAGAILGVLVSSADDAGDAASDMADKYGDAAADVELAADAMDQAIGSIRSGLNDAGNWFADFAIDVAGAMATATNKVADFVQRTNGLLPRAIDKLVLSGTAAGDNIQLLNPSVLEAEREAQRRQIAGRQADRALAATAGNQIFGFDPYKDGEFSPFDPKSLDAFAKGAERAREEGEREAKRLADTAKREAKSAADAAVRAAERAAAAQAQLIEGLAAVARKTAQEIDQLARGDGSLLALLERLNGADAARSAAIDRSRDATGLGAAVAGAERNIDYQREQIEIARLQAQAFNQAVLAEAGFLGSAIGGAAGSIIQGAAGIAQGLSNGDFRGVGGRAGGVLNLASQSIGQDGWRQVTGKLDEVFGGQSGDGSFIKRFSAVVAAAGIGASVAGGSRESQIGGAVGGVIGQEAGKAIGKAIGGLGETLGGPLGSIVGGLLGGALGGLLRPVRTGSVSITGSGGTINQGAAVGTGGVQRQNAGILGNDFTNSLNQIVDRLGGTIGTFAVSIGQSNGNFRVDTTGAGRTNKRQAGVLAFGEDSASAVNAALADAIRDGAVGNVSPRVQSVLRQYADNIDRAVAEALKVQDLEFLLEDRANPFGRAFREFERQAADRLKVARQYGFDVLEIEKVNAEERAKLLKEQLADTTASARALLDDLRFGSRSEGSVRDRLNALGTERARLEGLVAGGDTSQIDALAQIIQQQLDLSREAFGSTGQFAADRTGAISSLESLIRQTEDRINAAASSAQTATVDKLTELNTSADEQVTELQRQTAILQQLAQGGGLAGLDLSVFARVSV